MKYSLKNIGKRGVFIIIVIIIFIYFGKILFDPDFVVLIPVFLSFLVLYEFCISIFNYKEYREQSVKNLTDSGVINTIYFLLRFGLLFLIIIYFPFLWLIGYVKIDFGYFGLIPSLIIIGVFYAFAFILGWISSFIFLKVYKLIVGNNKNNIL